LPVYLTERLAQLRKRCISFTDFEVAQGRQREGFHEKKADQVEDVRQVKWK